MAKVVQHPTDCKGCPDCAWEDERWMEWLSAYVKRETDLTWPEWRNGLMAAEVPDRCLFTAHCSCKYRCCYCDRRHHNDGTSDALKQGA